MGAEESCVELDESVRPQTLENRDLKSVARLIKDGKIKNIVVMTGAGISTSAGIPDFRSPKTGLYANLARLDLPHAEAVFDISYFRQKPEPFYILARDPLYPGQFKPTLAHCFIALLEQKNLLSMLFTQNIDCLERVAGVSDTKIVEAHGSFATQRCIDCKTPYPDNLMKESVQASRVPHCQTPECNGLVKPDIVFFGEALPHRFFEHAHVPQLSDLAIIIGTSLTVQPFASLPQAVPEGVPRVLFNMERVGDLGTRADDVCVLGNCDDSARSLAEELGWTAELQKLFRARGGKDTLISTAEQDKSDTHDSVESNIEKITSDIGSNLTIGDDDRPTTKQQKGERDGPSFLKWKNSDKEKKEESHL